jgi:hypothetical protein
MIDAAFFFKPPIEGGIYGTSPPKQWDRSRWGIQARENCLTAWLTLSLSPLSRSDIAVEHPLPIDDWCVEHRVSFVNQYPWSGESTSCRLSREYLEEFDQWRIPLWHAQIPAWGSGFFDFPKTNLKPWIPKP